MGTCIYTPWFVVISQERDHVWENPSLAWRSSSLWYHFCRISPFLVREGLTAWTSLLSTAALPICLVGTTLLPRRDVISTDLQPLKTVSSNTKWSHSMPADIKQTFPLSVPVMLTFAETSPKMVSPDYIILLKSFTKGFVFTNVA